MSLTRVRIGLAVMLAVLVVASLFFYERQNTGLQVGGAISLPKMLWLFYALATWFILPPFLWLDARLDKRVRRLFAAFWLFMAARGVVEMTLIYQVGHWNPWYGIAHDLSSIGLLLFFRRGLCPTDVASRRALRFSGSMVIALIAETSFAGMFLQTSSHETAIYFASADASWGYINLITTGVLLFVYPDFLTTLMALYYPGVSRDTPRSVRIIRGVSGAVVVCVVVGGLGFWTWMRGAEAEAKRFQEIGTQIADSCNLFRDDFLRADEQAMELFISDSAGVDSREAVKASWHAVPVRHDHPFELRRWEKNGPSRPLSKALLQMRQSFSSVRHAAFKVHLVDDFGADWALAQVRFEVAGGAGSDLGLFRFRFQPGSDGRWQVTQAELIEGFSSRGPGTHFQDLAKERGVDFVLAPDRRFTPGMQCSEHACEGPTQLKFQTMRFAYAGCATADFDGDGHDDVFFCAGDKSALFKNRGDGTFENATENAGLSRIWHTTTAGFSDLDNDGDQDLFLGTFYGPNRLFENTGKGTFREVSVTSGLGRDDMVTCFSFFDYDRDGDLDLYLGRYLDARIAIPDSFLYARNGQPNRLYRNDGGLRFTDVTSEAGVGDRGLTLSLAAADYDDDGDQDLYVANDFGRNALYENQGDGTFRDAALEAGTLAIGGSMSASWGDYDNDGRLDLYVAAIRSNQRWFVQPLTARRVVLKFIREGKIGVDNPAFSDLKNYMGSNWVNIGNHALAGNSLLHQNADGTFTEMAEIAHARPAGWYWSSGFLDIDQDGDLDILATDGWITGENSHDL